MDSTITGALIGVAGGLIGILVGSRLSKNATLSGVESSNRNAIRIMQRQDFNKAATKFHASFVNEIRILDDMFHESDTTDIEVYDLLSNSLVRHEKAVILFRPYLSRSARKRFDTEWQEYCDPEKIDMPGFSFQAYHESQCEVGKENYNGKYALNKINHLLSFAKPK